MSRLDKRHRLIVLWSFRTGIVLAAIALWAVLTGRQPAEQVVPGQRVEGITSVLSQGTRDATSPIRFEDVTSASGIPFRHFAAKRASLLPEDMGSGIALGDYDNDGLTDIFCVNFAGSIVEALPEDEPAAPCRLYRNLGNMQFEDVTERSGLGLVAFGMGAGRFLG